MIKILEIANFEVDTSPVDRNRKTISELLDKEKFKVINITGKDKMKAATDLLRKFDVIHTRSWPICIRLLNIAKIRNRNIKHLYSVHGLDDDKDCFEAARTLAKRADVVHCVSKITADQVKKEYGCESIVIYNGIDTQKYKPMKHNNQRIKIINVGSYVERKKPQYVLELAKQFPQCDFIMYGGHSDTKLFQDIQAEAKKLNNLVVEKTVGREQLMGQLQTADIFLFPTLHEGFANVLVEATAVGLPVVAFNISSVPEIIEHKKNGLLSEAKMIKGTEEDLATLKFADVDLDIEEMKDHLRYLIENEKELKDMSRNARLTAEKYDWKSIAKQYEKTYEEMCS